MMNQPVNLMLLNSLGSLSLNMHLTLVIYVELASVQEESRMILYLRDICRQMAVVDSDSFLFSSAHELM